MDLNNLLLKIEASLQDLRPSEQKVARCVIDNYEQVKFMTVSELASRSDVSEASVMRFIKSLGFKGFQYFKLALASVGNGNHETPKVKEVTEDDSVMDIKETIQNNCVASIQDTFSVLEVKSLTKAVDLILDAKQIFVVGVGSSGILAQLLSYNLLRMGIMTNFLSDPHLQAMKTSLIDSDSLVIGISHSGSTKDTVDVLKLAHDNGAKTICITGHVKSPIARYSDVLLCTYAREDPLGISQGRSSVSQTYAIETLTACIYSEIKEEANLARKTTAQSVLGKLY